MRYFPLTQIHIVDGDKFIRQDDDHYDDDDDNDDNQGALDGARGAGEVPGDPPRDHGEELLLQLDQGVLLRQGEIDDDDDDDDDDDVLR